MAGCQEGLLNRKRFSDLSFVHSGTKEAFVSILGQGRKREGDVATAAIRVEARY